VLSPWTIRNYSKYGRLVLVRPLPSKALPDFKDSVAQAEKISNGFKDVADYYRENPTGTQEDAISQTFLHYLKNPWGSVKFMFEEMVHFWSLYPDRLNTESPQFRAKIHAQDSRMVLGGDRFWSMAKIISIVVMLPVFVFALIGLFSVRPLGHDKMLFLLSILSLSIGYSLIYAEVRYRIPIEPYVLMFTAFGFYTVCTRLGLRCARTFDRTGVSHGGNG
jgi:hypothetical protein